MRIGSWLVDKRLGGILERLQHTAQDWRRIVVIGAVDEKPPSFFVSLLNHLAWQRTSEKTMTKPLANIDLCQRQPSHIDPPRANTS